ncbi:MAG TPA: hypothetical protein VFF28_00215 [Candidatus Nanoarchaeia archaeon]|nr:hypothetical protein [Candidatus Nanoarchaeia archaeon]
MESERKMYTYIKHLELFEKIKVARNLIDESFPGLDGDSLMTMLCHIAHHHYHEKMMDLNEREMFLYDKLLKYGYNPSTVYKWFLLTKVPEDIKGRIKRQEISQKQAFRMSFNRKRVKEVNLGFQLMEEARAAIRGL